jgi:hypothetical protein
MEPEQQKHSQLLASAQDKAATYAYIEKKTTRHGLNYHRQIGPNKGT